MNLKFWKTTARSSVQVPLIPTALLFFTVGLGFGVWLTMTLKAL